MKYLKNVKIVNSLRVLETVFEHTEKVYNYTKLNIGNKINFKQKRKATKAKKQHSNSGNLAQFQGKSKWGLVTRHPFLNLCAWCPYLPRYTHVSFVLNQLSYQLPYWKFETLLEMQIKITILTFAFSFSSSSANWNKRGARQQLEWELRVATFKDSEKI